MLKLYNIYEGLIMETVMRDAIIDVINKKQRVKITYQSDDEKRKPHTGERYIEVYTYGIKGKPKSTNGEVESDEDKKSTGGYEAIRAYQLSGDTSSVKPMWKFFKVENILTWEPVNSFFKTSIEHRDDNHVDPRTGEKINVNHDGDEHMSVIHAQVNFDDDHIGNYQQRKELEKQDRIERERIARNKRVDAMIYKNHQADVEKRRQQAMKDREEMEQRAQQTRQMQQQQMQQQEIPPQNNDYEEEDIEDDNEPDTSEYGY